MYSYDNFAKVKEELDKKRQAALAEAERRTFMLRMESAEIKAIDDELSGTGFALFKAACEKKDITPIKERNLELQKMKRDIIKSLGYPEDYTEVKYSCSKCSDTGYTTSGAMCPCFKEALVKETVISSGMGQLIEKQSFDNFDFSGYDESTLEIMQRTVAIAKDFAVNFGKKPNSLVLFGKTGTGKTHISSAIAREVITKGYDVIYDSAQNIMNDYENDRFRSGYGQKEIRSERYTECDLLIIDDLGTEFTTPFTVSTIYNLLNARICAGKAMIISTNIPLKQLDDCYHSRISSRLCFEFDPVPFVGKDVRQKKKRK